MIGLFLKKKKKGELFEVEENLAYRFRNKDLLNKALTHSSFAY